MSEKSVQSLSSDYDWIKRTNLANTVRNKKDLAREDILALMWLLKDQMILVRVVAAESLVRIFQDNKKSNKFAKVKGRVILTLNRVLNEKTKTIRDKRAMLGALVAMKSFSDVIKALNHPLEQISSKAATHLGEHHVSEALPKLIFHLNDESPLVQKNAALAIGPIIFKKGCDDLYRKQSISGLMDLLKNDSQDVCRAAITSLWRIKAFEAKKAIIKCLNNIRDKLSELQVKNIEKIIEKLTPEVPNN